MIISEHKLSEGRRAAMEIIVRDRIYINGKWVPSIGIGMIEVINPATEEVMGKIPDGTAEDVDMAAKAAAAAFPAWSRTPLEERLEFIARIAAGIQPRMQEIAELISREVGTPLKLSARVQAGLPFASFSNIPEAVRMVKWEEQIGNSQVVREAVGVVGCITPWNYPLHQIAAKVAPALAAGCTIVLKPTEIAPLNSYILAEIIDEAGLPPGVFNMVMGKGPVVGEAIASHPLIDMVSFTGSTTAGRRVSELATQTLKRVALELGGKSPNIILDDADLSKVVADGIGKCYMNSGQTCSALTRMLVPRSRLAEAEEVAATVAARFTPGDPFDEKTRLGPLVSAAQLERVRGYIRKGIEEGAKLVAGGPEPPAGLERGYFVRPTVFSNVNNSMTIAQEEIFGPVLTIIPYEDEEDAIRIANDTVYGLAAGVWSADPERARRVAGRIRAGQVEVNGGRFNSLAPFGGFKQSGHGREYGPFGIEEFLEVKALLL
jgi:acyl-CoA reductase-like NAD-dependent aldehyde dehydrogenase